MSGDPDFTSRSTQPITWILEGAHRPATRLRLRLSHHLGTSDRKVYAAGVNFGGAILRSRRPGLPGPTRGKAKDTTFWRE